MKKNLNWFTALVILSLHLLQSSAQTVSRTGSTSSSSGIGEPGTSLPSNYFEAKMPNGLTVLVVEDHSVPLYTIEIAVKNGSYTEPSEFNGLSHLYEHMFFKANKTYPSQEAFIDRTKELGMVWNGTTGEERVNYYFTAPKKFLSQGIEFMADAIQYPKFSPEEMKKENVVVDGEFQRAESNPGYFLGDTCNHSLYGALYSRKNVIGDHAVILSATPEKMRVIQGKYYVPNNSLLTIAGDVGHKDVLAQVGEALSAWKPSSEDPHLKYPEPEFPQLAASKYLVIDKSFAKNPMIEFTWLGPSVGKDPSATYDLDVLGTILSQNSSTFQHKLVNSGLASQANFSYYTLNHTGPIRLFLVPNPDSIKECIQVVKAELAKMASPDYFTEGQLLKAKNQLVINDAYEKERTSSLVHTLSFYWSISGFPYYARYLDHTQKVSRESIAGTLQHYVVGKPFVAGIILTPELRKASKIDTFFN